MRPDDPFATTVAHTGPALSMAGDWLPVMGWIGPPPDSTPTVDGDDGQEYIGLPGVIGLRTLPQIVDELTAVLGPGVYDAMGADPVICATTRALRAGAVGEGVSLASRYPVADGVDFDPDEPPDGATDDQIEAKRALDFCRWLDECLESTTPLNQVAYQLTKCFVWKNALAEKVLESRTDPKGNVRIVSTGLHVKDWRQWWFVIDRFGHPIDVLAHAGDIKGGYVRIPLDHFVYSVFLPDDDTPIGQSGYLPLHTWWKLKYQVPANAAKFLAVFSLPIPTITMAENARAQVPRDKGGNVISGAPEVKPTQQVEMALRQIRAGVGAGLPFGAEAKLLESQKNADPFAKTVDLCDRQIVHGITGSARTNLEARNGSKADAESSQDVGFDLIRALLRGCVARALRQHHYHDGLTRNFGREFADRYTPTVSFGQANKQDFASAASALSSLAGSGLIAPSQYEAAIRIVLGLDLPERTEDEINPPDQQVESGAVPGQEGEADDE